MVRDQDEEDEKDEEIRCLEGESFGVDDLRRSA